MAGDRTAGTSGSFPRARRSTTLSGVDPLPPPPTPPWPSAVSRERRPPPADAWWVGSARYAAYAWTALTTLGALVWVAVGVWRAPVDSELHRLSYALWLLVALTVAQLAGGWLGVAALLHRRHHRLPLP